MNRRIYEVNAMEFSEVVSERILQYCKEKNITVNKLATLSGMAQSTVDNIIKKNTKNPSLRSIRRISQGLGITTSEFLDFPEFNESVFEDE
jgi:transcriptional regulator with XRE-family HTH domain